MPIAPPEIETNSKPKHVCTRLKNSEPLSNEAELVGRRVRIVARRVIPKYRGAVGKILNVVTAEPLVPRLHEAGCRGVYYSVELDDAVLEGLTWEDILQVTTHSTETKKR